MKLRCDLEVNGGSRKLLIFQGPNELAERLALKLAAYLLFWDREPLIDASTKTPALADYEFLPDVLCLDGAGEIAVWIDCGTTTMHKLTKLTRRIPAGRGRVVVLKASPRDAERLRADVDAQHDKPQRVEILSFPEGAYKQWLSAVAEKTEVFGEASERSINAVVNQTPFALEFRRY